MPARINTQMSGLSQTQQNSCRTALNLFIEKHELGDWEMEIDTRETLPMGYSVHIALTPPAGTGLAQGPISEFAAVDSADAVPVVVDRLLEAAYRGVRRPRAISVDV